MKPAYIVAELKLKGYSGADVARELGLSRQTISVVINGWGKSRRVANRISQIIGISVAALWPGIYSEPATRHVRKAA